MSKILPIETAPILEFVRQLLMAVWLPSIRCFKDSKSPRSASDNSCLIKFSLIASMAFDVVVFMIGNWRAIQMQARMSIQMTAVNMAFIPLLPNVIGLATRKWERHLG